MRANASQTQTIAMLFDKGYQTVSAEYCATVNRSNFKDPIPACAGMTRSENCFLFYDHCSNLCCGVFLGCHSGACPGPAKLINFVGGYQAGVHCPAGTSLPHQKNPQKIMPNKMDKSRGNLGKNTYKTMPKKNGGLISA